MNKLEQSKAAYEKIRIPKELDASVQSAVRLSGKRLRNKKIRTVSGWAAGMAAALFITLVAGANSNPVFAKELQEIPVVGQIFRLLTVSSYEEQQDDISISVKIPGIEAIAKDNSGLSGQVNQEIYDLCNSYAEEARQRAEEYRQAFLDTGGTEEEWSAHDIRIQVGYEKKSQSDSHLSFAVNGTENWNASYAETRYYNLDLVNMRYLTLKDVLGSDYISIANESIKAQIEELKKNPSNTLLSPEEGSFTTITEDATFYLNSLGNPVVIFDKYELGPGSMGIMEFEIKTQD